MITEHGFSWYIPIFNLFFQSRLTFQKIKIDISNVDFQMVQGGAVFIHVSGRCLVKYFHVVVIESVELVYFVCNENVNVK